MGRIFAASIEHRGRRSVYPPATYAVVATLPAAIRTWKTSHRLWGHKFSRSPHAQFVASQPSIHESPLGRPGFRKAKWSRTTQSNRLMATSEVGIIYTLTVKSERNACVFVPGCVYFMLRLLCVKHIYELPTPPLGQSQLDARPQMAFCKEYISRKLTVILGRRPYLGYEGGNCEHRITDDNCSPVGGHSSKYVVFAWGPCAFAENFVVPFTLRVPNEVIFPLRMPLVNVVGWNLWCRWGYFILLWKALRFHLIGRYLWWTVCSVRSSTTSGWNIFGRLNFEQN